MIEIKSESIGMKSHYMSSWNGHTLITDIEPVLNCNTPCPSLFGSKFWASE